MPHQHRPLAEDPSDIPISISTVTGSFESAGDHRASVLHVDDEPDFAEMTKAFLERIDDDLSVETATSASDGLERLKAGSYDGVISDYQMPRMDGLEFLEAVRDDHPELPFILCTARGSEEIASEALAAGVTDYIQKKSDTDQYEVLANRLRNAIDQYRTRRRLWETQTWSTQLLDQALVGIYIIQDGTFSFVNNRLAELFGYEAEALVGEPPTTLAPTAPDTDDAATCLEAVPPNTTNARYHGHGQTRSGSTIGFDVEVATVTFNGDPAALGVLRRSDGRPGTDEGSS